MSRQPNNHAKLSDSDFFSSHLNSNRSASKRKSMKLSHKSTIPQCRYATITKKMALTSWDSERANRCQNSNIMYSIWESKREKSVNIRMKKTKKASEATNYVDVKRKRYRHTAQMNCTNWTQRPERETLRTRVNVTQSLTLRPQAKIPNAECVVLHAATNSFFAEFIHFKWPFVGQTTQFYLGQHFVVAAAAAGGLICILCFSIHSSENSSSSLSSHKFETHNCIVSITIFMYFYKQTLLIFFCCFHVKTAKIEPNIQKMQLRVTAAARGKNAQTHSESVYMWCDTLWFHEFSSDDFLFLFLSACWCKSTYTVTGFDDKIPRAF